MYRRTECRPPERSDGAPPRSRSGRVVRVGGSVMGMLAMISGLHTYSVGLMLLVMHLGVGRVGAFQ